MRYFPQLDGGAAAQYPLRRTWRRQLVESTTPGGRTWWWFDGGSAQRRWTLALNGLTAAEKQRLEEFFSECGGQLHTFLFLDPAANLLAWSEDLENEVWVRPSGLALTAGIDDPEGQRRAFRITNNSQAPLRLAQVLAMPGARQYAFSVALRGPGVAAAQLFIRSGDSERTTLISAATSWTRPQITGANLGSAETVEFGVEIPAGGVVEVYGPQAEVQLSATRYKATTRARGVYPNARFDQDALTFVAAGPDDYSTVVKMVAPTPE
jgi:hypothetical protein